MNTLPPEMIEYIGDYCGHIKTKQHMRLTCKLFSHVKLRNSIIQKSLRYHNPEMVFMLIKIMDVWFDMRLKLFKIAPPESASIIINDDPYRESYLYCPLNLVHLVNMDIVKYMFKVNLSPNYNNYHYKINTDGKYIITRYLQNHRTNDIISADIYTSLVYNARCEVVFIYAIAMVAIFAVLLHLYAIILAWVN